MTEMCPLDMRRDTRTCSQCGIEKLLDQFWTSYDRRYSLRRTRSYCKSCGKKYNEHTKYSLTADDRKALEIAQGHACAICRKRGRLVVDHDHSTGKVRGLLCSSCNTGIGLLGDDINRLTDATTYLRGGE